MNSLITRPSGAGMISSLGSRKETRKKSKKSHTCRTGNQGLFSAYRTQNKQWQQTFSVYPACSHSSSVSPLSFSPLTGWFARGTLPLRLKGSNSSQFITLHQTRELVNQANDIH
ncbi:hypothetical protein BaRGS_00003545 [Batillaria attramentaria]|uniref:Uncharacterized protein n=1 Tax=Batillaria attramentaria TaxID=370345 RepID=A0ABD0M252_9CAEN